MLFSRGPLVLVVTSFPASSLGGAFFFDGAGGFVRGFGTLSAAQGRPCDRAFSDFRDRPGRAGAGARGLRSRAFELGRLPDSSAKLWQAC